MTKSKSKYPAPPYRRLQIFSLDPAADIEMDTAMISRATVLVPWEELEEGPIGEYLEVIDYDPSSGKYYEPVDLDEVLSGDGLAPSTGSPLFHQQMVYAVASITIANFERVLGRKILWAQRVQDENGDDLRSYDSRRFVRRLRIYPHAIRDQNAYYSPAKKALLFGYFNAPSEDVRDGLPGGMVFTCLSHDIIAHETTHAILDGIHPRLLKPSNPDMLALHEAFSDIVAIFQHFCLPNLLLDQIQKTRGELLHDNLLSKLAIQFARSTNKGNALRNALGTVDAHGKRLAPDPTLIDRTTKPHDRGAILVAAVYSAFFRIYEGRVADLRRIATNGTGVLPEGDIHPDLAMRFAMEAANAADRVLTVCIRAIDYIPAVDCDFGDYLRALITADADLVPDDPRRFRLAFIEAFQEHGIYPRDVRTLSEESLLWNKIRTAHDQVLLKNFLPSTRILQTMATAYGEHGFDMNNFVKAESHNGDGGVFEIFRDKTSVDITYIEQAFLKRFWVDREDSSEDAPEEIESRSGNVDRFNMHILSQLFGEFLHLWISVRVEMGISNNDRRDLQRILGIDLSLNKSGKFEYPIEVHTVRPAVKSVPKGGSKSQLLIVLTQKERLNSLDDRKSQDLSENVLDGLSFIFRGGCTLIIDPNKGSVEYAITKRIGSQARKSRQRRFLKARYESEGEESRRFLGIRAEADQIKDHSRFPGEHLASIHGDRSGYGEY